MTSTNNTTVITVHQDNGRLFGAYAVASESGIAAAEAIESAVRAMLPHGWTAHHNGQDAREFAKWWATPCQHVTRDDLAAIIPAPVDPAPAAVDVDTESRIVAEKVRREAFGDWSPWTVYPERDERCGWTVTRTRGNERQLFMRSSDDWLVAARIACELNWNEGLRPAAVDTGTQHGPSIIDLLAGRDGLQLPTSAEAAAWWDEMARRNPSTTAAYAALVAFCEDLANPANSVAWLAEYDRLNAAYQQAIASTPAASIDAVPQTVIAENAHYQLLAADGAAFLAAHDRKQALRTAHNELDRWFAAAPLNERQAAFRDAMHAALDRIHAAGASPERIAEAAHALKHADCYARLNAVADQYAA